MKECIRSGSPQSRLAAFLGVAILASCSEDKPALSAPETTIGQPARVESTARAPEPVAAQPVLEEMQCSEVQVMPRLQGGEPTQRIRKPSTKLRLLRHASSYSLTVPAGATVGLTPATNNYVPEERDKLLEQRQVSFDIARSVVHCATEPVDPSEPSAPR